jgi:hypothetical protein
MRRYSGQKRTDLGGKQEPAVLIMIIERLDPQPVPGQEEAFALLVPEGEGKHPDKLGQTFRPVLLILVQDHLGVGAGLEGVPGRGPGRP